MSGDDHLIKPDNDDAHWYGGKVQKREAMSIVGELFAVRFFDEGDQQMVGLYVEDDENYHLKMTFNRAWLADLKAVAEDALFREHP